MADILQKIVDSKMVEITGLKEVISIKSLEKQIITNSRSANSLSQQLITQPGIIAEFKRASPSKGIINSLAEPTEIVSGYAEQGAIAISVLTDTTYFKAEPNDFAQARSCTSNPILRKEFIIDEYQIYQSKAMRADVILLIAAVLTAKQIKDFTTLAHRLNLEVLIELHASNEIDKLCGDENVVGVNNRNLKTFEVNINQSIKLKKQLGDIHCPLISESGLTSITTVEQLLSEGFSGFLMGEHFMRQKNPVKAFSLFNNSFQQLIKKG